MVVVVVALLFCIQTIKREALEKREASNMKGRRTLLPYIESIERGCRTERGFQSEGVALLFCIETIKREAREKREASNMKGKGNPPSLY